MFLIVLKNRPSVKSLRGGQEGKKIISILASWTPILASTLRNVWTQNFKFRTRKITELATLTAENLRAIWRWKGIIYGSFWEMHGTERTLFGKPVDQIDDAQ